MEILNTFTIPEGSVGFVILVGIVSVFFLFLLIASVLGREVLLFAISIIFLVFLVSIAIDEIRIINQPDKTRHEVIITDISKFDTSKYKIVEQRGKIFVVEEITE